MAAHPPKTAGSGLPASRRRGRVLALQVLYELDLTGHSWQEALQNLVEGSRAAEQAISFAKECIDGVVGHDEELAGLIRRFAPAWPLSQLAVVDRSILRLALYELRFASREPPKVIINEAVELAKIYGGDSSYRLVNGVLGSVLVEVAPDEHKRDPSISKD